MDKPLCENRPITQDRDIKGSNIEIFVYPHGKMRTPPFPQSVNSRGSQGTNRMGRDMLLDVSRWTEEVLDPG